MKTLSNLNVYSAIGMAVPAKPSVLVTKTLVDGQRGTFINFVHFSDDVYFHIHVDFAFDVAFITRV